MFGNQTRGELHTLRCPVSFHSLSVHACAMSHFVSLLRNTHSVYAIRCIFAESEKVAARSGGSTQWSRGRRIFRPPTILARRSWREMRTALTTWREIRNGGIHREGTRVANITALPKPKAQIQWVPGPNLTLPHAFPAPSINTCSSSQSCQLSPICHSHHVACLATKIPCFVVTSSRPSRKGFCMRATFPQ